MANTRTRPAAQTRTEIATTQAPPAEPVVQGTLLLQGTRSDSRVTFAEETVDNENLNKKKSKICCIYKKPYDPNVSSDDSSEEDDLNDYERQPKYKKKHTCNH